MDQLDAMRVFVAVVEAGGFSAASRGLGMPLPTVSRKVGDLEDRLGAQLLTRSTRKVAPTDVGLRYYEDARRILEAVEAARRQASGEYQRATGRLTVTAPPVLAQILVLPVVNEFMREHAEVEVQIISTTRVLDLPEEHIDLGIRLGVPPSGGLSVLPAGSVRQVICASPTYLDLHGRPSSPEDILRHRCITFAPSGVQLPWQFRLPSGKREEITVRPRLSFLYHGASAVDAALQGTGLAQLYAYGAARHVAAGALEIVLRDFEIEPTPLNIVLPRGQHMPQKVMAFLDIAVPILRARLTAVAEACEA